MRNLLATVLLLAAPAAAEPIAKASVSGSTITQYSTSERPGAIGEIRFFNRAVNGPHNENRTYDLADGYSFVFEHDVNGSAQDQIIVSVPEGVICDPYTCELALHEVEGGTIVLYSMEGVGF